MADVEFKNCELCEKLFDPCKSTDKNKGIVAMRVTKDIKMVKLDENQRNINIKILI